MTDTPPEPVPDENRFELTIVATGVVSEATPDEGETP